MKKLLFLTLITISIIIPCQSHAIDMTAGLTGWYAWGEQYNVQTGKAHNSVIDSDPSLLFGLATLSGLYLFGKDSFVTTDMWSSPAKLSDVKLAYNEYGFNSNISLAYYISDWSTVISLGYRFQYLLADYKDKDNDVYLDYIRFIIHGVTLTATYTFGI